jgi:predicted transcriptional regulator
MDKSLKDLRRLCGVSQIELAHDSGVSRNRIQLAEAGTIELRSEEIQAIRKALKPRLERTAELIAGSPGFHSNTEQH